MRKAIQRIAPLAVIAATAVFLAAGGCCSLAIETDSLPPGAVGRPYAFTMSSDCGGDFWFLSDGNLPPGVFLDSDGAFGGTPALAGTYVFTVGLEDFSGDVVFRGFSIAVSP